LDTVSTDLDIVAQIWGQINLFLCLASLIVDRFHRQSSLSHLQRVSERVSSFKHVAVELILLKEITLVSLLNHAQVRIKIIVSWCHSCSI
jgi:hypothetical protein